jgi:hypothetical protein
MLSAIVPNPSKKSKTLQNLQTAQLDGKQLESNPSGPEAAISSQKGDLAPGVGEFSIAWPTHVGTYYRVESPADLNRWLAEGDWLPGIVKTVQRAFSTIENSRLFRLAFEIWVFTESPGYLRYPHRAHAAHHSQSNTSQ